MTAIRKIIRAFLASPGDLQEERKAIRTVVNEFNESWADELGYQVELLGWEDTVSDFGRPQNLINQEVDRCDIFIGMMWKRWGTPPDNKGRYTSGFHEEFDRSIKRHEISGKPEISLFFKEIDEAFMEDKGPDLKKVLEFKKDIVDKKTIFYQGFKTIREIEKLINKRLARSVNKIRKEENLKAQEDFSKQTETGDTEEPSDTTREDLSPLSSEGFSFLKMFIDKIRNPEGLENSTASDIARFRLLANSVGKTGNDDRQLGVHDINILFANRNKLKLGNVEFRSLLKFGLKNLHNENVPLWYWYSQIKVDGYIDLAFYSMIGQDDDKKVGAIRLLTLLGIELPDNDSIKRKWMTDTWFSDQSSTPVKNAALHYLVNCGIITDFKIAEAEYERNDRGTSLNALECMISILYRAGKQGEAEKFVLEKQFDTMDISILKNVLKRFDNLDTNQLLTGLEHRNSEVRLRTLKVLSARKALTTEIIEKCKQDSDARIRLEALKILVSRGEVFSDEESKKILVRPKKQSAVSLYSASWYMDDKGEEYFETFQIERLYELNEKKLFDMVDEAILYDDASYFVLMEKYFSKHADQLRSNIDDKFRGFLDEKIAPLKAVVNIEKIKKIVERAEDMRDFSQKELTRRGLDILCRKGNLKDLNRIRENLRTGYAGASTLDAEYLKKHGEWDDIELLVNAGGPQIGKTLLTAGYEEGFQDTVAKALYRIGKHSISELLLMELPSEIIHKILGICSESIFRNISDKALFGLLNNKSDNVRKAASMFAVRAFTTKRTKAILDQYVSGEDYRYYNVIHWLDLGASMTRSESKRIVMGASG